AESYAKTQSYNSSVGECATFAYTTALNYLLADSEHVKIIGDTTVVYWAKTAEAEFQDLVNSELLGDEDSEFSEEDLKGAMRELAKGHTYDMNGFILNPKTEFYILGLSPNAARLSVRFFYRNTFGSLMKNLEEHYERMEIVRPSFDNAERLSIWKLLNETVNPKSKDKSASPLLAGALAMSILNNQRYPAVLMNAIMLRIRAEQNVNRARAGIIKAFLLKNSSNKYIREALTMELNEQCDYMPYVLGRLFSVLEEIQEVANPGLNATIKDRFFNSASSTPAIIFPQILNLKNNHIKVLRREKFGYAVNLEKKVQELLSLIHESFPKHLNIEDQGTFNIGYYHQTQKRFEKKIKENNKNENTIENNKED
ncbi:MAG: type I-C CRISPR-associated protein Cas8c/Csd1, partial [Oscillospiraceae bacterium]